jgi:1-acyl-sn-glycerol-3-phosphate acyltransferase
MKTSFLWFVCRSVLSVFVWAYVGFATILVFISVAILYPFDRNNNLSHHVTKIWGKTIVAINPFWKLKIKGKHRIKKSQSYVLVANHMSLADIVCVYCIGNNFKWVAKSSLFKVPFLGWSMSLMKYIRLERNDRSSIREAMELAKRYLEQNVSILFFAEGTRSKSGSLGAFKNGAFKLAIQTGKPIIPIVIHGTHQALKRGEAAAAGSASGYVRVLPKIDVNQFKPDEYGKLKQIVWNQMSETIEKFR